tara:strand:- start:1730 stop:2746 length:1017 start_codon:yes stop_codon:yes gene_type:complete
MSDKKVDPRIAAYVTTSTDDLIEDEKRFGKGKRIPRIKVEAGTTRNLRLLKEPTASKFYVARKQHWKIPYGMGKVPPQTCSWAHENESCYHCGQVNEYFNAGDPRLKNIAHEIKASANYMSNVLDLDDATNEDGSPKVQIWAYSQTVFRELKGYFQDPEYGDLAHPLEGRDLKVSAEITGEQGGNTWTKYSVRVRGKVTPLEHLDALDVLYDLNEEYPLKIYPYHIQEGIFNGTRDPRSGKPKQALSAGPASAGQLGSGDDDFESAKTDAAPATDVEDLSSAEELVEESAEEPEEKAEESSDDGWGDEDDPDVADVSEDQSVTDIKKKLQAAINKKKK